MGDRMGDRPDKPWGRGTNQDKLKFFIQDDEQTMLYTPEDFSGNKWFGKWSELLTM
jgi:hypothetical protein